MQRLARHSTAELTLGRYTHAHLHDLQSAVESLPPLPVSTDEEKEKAAIDRIEALQKKRGDMA